MNRPPPPLSRRYWALVGAVASVAALFLAVNLMLLANIHRRRRAEAALRAREARFRALVEYGSDLITTFRADRTIDYRSPSYERILGFTMAELDEMKAAIMHPDDLVRMDPILSEVLARSGNTYRGLARLRHKSGGWRWMEFVLHNHLDDPAVERIVLNAWDVTDRKRAEEERLQLLEREQLARRQAEAASRSKDEFLAILSHELRTPLTPILGWVRLLRSGGLPGDEASQALEAIERNAQAQTRLIEDLLDLSRIVTGKLKLELGPVDLVELVDSVLELVRPSAEAKAIRLVRSLPVASLPLRGDGDRLRQVLWNLLSNAIKFTPRQGRVEVRLESVPKGVEISVSDSGEGLTPEQIPYLFTRFWQADSTSTRRFGGLGLGLSIVRYVTEMHGGSVDVHSDGPGKGATFTVRLPATSSLAAGAKCGASASDEGAPAAAQESLEGLRVLVVEDDRDTRDLLGLTLESHGAEVELAGTADEALAAAERSPPDLLLADLGLPDRDGCVLLREIRSLAGGALASIPAIALTGYAHDDDKERALSAGFQLHLVKPIDPASLVVVLGELVRGQRAA